MCGYSSLDYPLHSTPQQYNTAADFTLSGKKRKRTNTEAEEGEGEGEGELEVKEEGEGEGKTPTAKKHKKEKKTKKERDFDFSAADEGDVSMETPVKTEPEDIEVYLITCIWLPCSRHYHYTDMLSGPHNLFCNPKTHALVYHTHSLIFCSLCSTDCKMLVQFQ